MVQRREKIVFQLLSDHLVFAYIGVRQTQIVGWACSNGKWYSQFHGLHKLVGNICTNTQKKTSTVVFFCGIFFEEVPTATATDLPLLALKLSTAGSKKSWDRVWVFCNGTDRQTNRRTLHPMTQSVKRLQMSKHFVTYRHFWTLF